MGCGVCGTCVVENMVLWSVWCVVENMVLWSVWCVVESVV